MWGSRSPSVLQLTQMAYAAGCALSPLLSREFLLGDMYRHGHHDHDDHHHHQTSPKPLHYWMDNITHESDINYSVDRRPRLKIPYMIVGAVGLITPVLLLIMYVVKRYKMPKMVTNTEPDKCGETTFTPRTRMIMIILAAMSLNCYSGVEQTYQNNGSTFYQYDPLVHISAHKAANIMALMTGCYALGPIASSFISRWFSPEVMLTYHLIIIAVSFVVLQFSQMNMIRIWIVNAFIGYGFSAMYPLYYSFTDKHLTFTNKISSIVSIASQCFPLMSPFLIGPLIEDHPHVLLDLEFGYLAD
ncbi:unnamed protein product, partial [Medioppia subpectinata]